MNARKLARNPWAILGFAALGGWLLGSGVFALPFALPRIGHPANPAAPVAPAALPASSSSAAAIAQTSAAMPTPSAAPDPFAGFNL